MWNESSGIDEAYIRYRIEELSPWYHKIDIGNGIITPGRDYENIWNPIRKLMDTVDYSGKTVLDLGSWDGMWAFEAERRGAKFVVASDTRVQGNENLLFVKEVTGSKVYPLFNLPVQELVQRLKIVGLVEKFDIIQHFGILYHLRDPLLSLAQCRQVIDDDGVLLLETAFVNNDTDSYMQFSGLPDKYHFYGPSDTWAPTKLCLKEVMIRSFFNPVNEDKWQYLLPNKTPNVIGRISMMAEVLNRSSGTEVDVHKVFGYQ